MVMRAFMRALTMVFAMSLAFGCAGSGCEGMEPIPGGFPLEQRAENAIQVRLTPDGVGFIENNIDSILAAAMGGSLLFEIPPTSQSGASICPDGGCYIALDIGSVNLVPSAPNYIQLLLDVHAFSANASGDPEPLPFVVLGFINCTANLDTELTGDPTLPVTGRVVFNINTTTGYTEIAFENLDATSGFENGDIDIDGGVIGECELIDLLKGLLIDSLLGGINDMLVGAMGDFTCMSCTIPEDCPTSATCDEGVCMQGGECVATLLGIEGRMDMGAMMSSFSPGLSASVDLLVAAGGYADANPHGDGGLSLGMYGGAEPVELATCVPHDVEPPPLGPVPIAQDIHSASSCPDCTPSEVHMALGTSETVLNRIGWALHQSGGLCLGVGAGTLPLTSNSLGMLLSDLESLTWDRDAPVAIELVPALPPIFEIGEGTDEDPLLMVTLPSLSVDFYIFVHDRWVRFMRLNSDLSVGLALEVVAGEIQFNVGSLTLANTTITDSNLITDDPEDIATSLEGLIGIIAGPMLGDVGSFALPDFSGFSLSIPEGGLGHVEEGSEEFLAIYASLGVAPTTSLLPDSMTGLETEAEIIELELPPTEEFAAPPTIPRLTVALDAPGASGEEVEFRTRLDTGFWSRWSTERVVVLEDGILTFQGRHRLYAQSRLYHQPDTADPEPVEIEVLIDTLPPEVTIADGEDDTFQLEVWDMISPAESVGVEWRPWGEEMWQTIGADLSIHESEATTIEVRATDEAGNVGVSRHELRGRVTETGDGCGSCSTTEGRHGRIPIALGLIAFAGMLFWRRRKAGLIVALIASMSLGACGGGDPENDGGPDGDGDADADADGDGDGDADPGECDGDDDCTGGRCCEATNLCVPFTADDDSCSEGSSCIDIPPLDESCQYEPCAECTDRPPLAFGLIGLHSSIATLPGGAAWVAGYAAGTRPGRPYGDLVVAQVSNGDNLVPDDAWVAIDGVPAAEPTGDIHGFRGGIEEPGDDVGMYASIASSSTGAVGIAYYDASNRSLKYVHNEGESWGTPVVVDGGEVDTDVGLFADLAFIQGDIPAIAYMVIEVGDSGQVITKARFARANDGTGSSWGTPVDLDILDNTPCTAMACEISEMSCDLDTGLCENPTADCTDCTAEQICVRGQCHGADLTPGTVPEGTGVWPELAVGIGNTLGVIFYDRTAGELVGAAYSGDSWSPPQVFLGVDGDVGWSPSLAIDATGVWHMSVVDGVAEDLLYHTSEGATEIIDGRTLGLHYNIRGDDSSIVVLPDGRIRVAYQDATDLQLWMAERDHSGQWTTTLLEAEGLSDTATQGFYIGHTTLETSSVVSAWYYDPLNDDANGVVLFWL